MRGIRLFIYRARLGRGASLLEYGILIALVTLVCLAGVRSLGIKVSDKIDMASGPLNGDYSAYPGGCKGGNGDQCGGSGGGPPPPP